MKILETVYEFHNKEYDTTCGLYYIELDSGSKHYIIRNNDSVGAICHYLGRPASECVSLIRDDVKQELFNIFRLREV